MLAPVLLIERLRAWWRSGPRQGKCSRWLVFRGLIRYESLSTRQLKGPCLSCLRACRERHKRVSMHTLSPRFAKHLPSRKRYSAFIHVLLGHKKLETTRDVYASGHQSILREVR